MIGQTLSGYEVVEAVDERTFRAAMGDKTAAVHPVALQADEAAAYQTRFGRLRHPHILPVYAAGEGYVITDLPKGGKLRDTLREPLELDHALLIAQQISGALAYAHGQELIHGGVRPRMIHFLDVEHQHAVLSGFGLPHKMSRRSVAYVSPEVAQDQPLDERSDVYSVGIVLHEMVLGKIPFAGNSMFAVLTQHVNEPVPELNDQLPEVAAYIIEKALQKEPKNRFQSAQALYEALQLARLTQSGGEVPSTMVGPPNTTIFKRPKRAPMVEVSAEPKPKKPSRFQFWKT